MGEAVIPEQSQGAWTAFVAAARTMAQLASVGVALWRGRGADLAVELVREAWDDHHGSTTALGEGPSAREEAARRAIIQGLARAPRGQGASLEISSSVENGWAFIPFGDGSRGLAVELAAPRDLDPSRSAIDLATRARAAQRIVTWALEARDGCRELERNESVQDAFGEGVIVIEATGRVATCTRRAATLLGVRAEDVEGRDVREALPGLPPRLEPHEVARGALSTSAGAGAPEGGTTELPRVIYVAQELAPSDAELATEGRGGMVVRLRGEARFAAQRKGQMLLLSSLRHDVRSPLTALRGLVGVLQEEPDMSREERLALLELLRQEAERTVTWVEDYLVLLRLRFDSRPSSPAQIPASRPAQAIADTFAKHARDRGIAFSVEVDPAAEARAISVDTTLIDPFCKNLVGHFLRLADTGAEVRVRSDARGRLVVEGQGPGLFAQHPPHPFTTLARSTAAGKRTPGVGLGLFVVKKIADVHGWPLSVRVEDGVVSLAVDWAR